MGITLAHSFLCDCWCFVKIYFSNSSLQFITHFLFSSSGHYISFTYVSIWWPSTEVRALPCSENTSVDKTIVPGPGCLQSLWHNWIILGCGAVSASCIGLAWEISALLGPLSQDWILNRRQRSECLSKTKCRDAVSLGEVLEAALYSLSLWPWDTLSPREASADVIIDAALCRVL